MRNISISKSQLKFFIKRLSEDEVEELMFVLTKKGTGFQIEWVAESIGKRKAYSESRRKNRSKKNKETLNNTSFSYDAHMENENESEKEVEYHIENAYDYLKEKNSEKIEVFEMQNKKSFQDYNQFIENFNCKVVEERIEWDFDILLARLRRLNTNWDKTPKNNFNKTPKKEKKDAAQILQERYGIE